MLALPRVPLADWIPSVAEASLVFFWRGGVRCRRHEDSRDMRFEVSVSEGGRRGIRVRSARPVMAYVREARAEGEGWSGIASQVGLSATALRIRPTDRVALLRPRAGIHPRDVSRA